MSRTTFTFVALAVLAIAILCAPAKVPGQAPIAGGMSGGPVLDADSHLLGIIVGSVGAASPFGIVVPVKTICNLLGRT